MPTFARGLFLVMAGLTGCATMGNSPAQELAWERWRACDRFSRAAAPASLVLVKIYGCNGGPM